VISPFGACVDLISRGYNSTSTIRKYLADVAYCLCVPSSGPALPAASEAEWIFPAAIQQDE
jgi:hypothetical protein